MGSKGAPHFLFKAIVLSKDMDLYLEGPSKVGLFMYDNRTFVVENFNDEPVEINVVGDPEDVKMLRSLLNDETVSASYLLRNSSGGISSFNFPASQRQKQRYFFL